MKGKIRNVFETKRIKNNRLDKRKFKYKNFKNKMTLLKHQHLITNKYNLLKIYKDFIKQIIQIYQDSEKIRNFKTNWVA